MQPRRVDHDEVIKALAPNRADDALHIRVLPRRSRRRTNGLSIHQQYIPPNPEQIQKAKDAGNMAVRQQPPGVRVEFRNYVQPNDLMALDVDAKAALLSALSVQTYLEKQEDAVTLNVRFGALADGTSYTAQTNLDVKAKNIAVVVANAGHRPLAP